MEQRTIKFKAKCLDDSEWVEGYYIKKPSYHQTPKGDVVEDGEEHLIFGMTKDDVQPLCYEVDPFTVCQFTGILDKDNKEIFENDLIQDIQTKEVFAVVWNPVYACYSFLDEKRNTYAAKNFADYSSKRFLIVGNRFDRKEEK